uniref:Cell wall protein DAN4-like n=1 Tax=Saccoglossus kowalevskii TaxID=10224 RepID=A0ABM0LU10_SACKO
STTPKVTITPETESTKTSTLSAGPSVPPPTLASTTPEDTITPETESTKTSTLSTATSVTPPTLASTTPEDTITPETESTKTSTLSTATSVPPPTLASTTPEISITPGTESIKTSTLSTATSVPPPTLASTTPEVAITPETESTKTSTLSTTTSVPSPALASTTPGVTITPETESTKTSTLSTTTSVPSPTSASTSPEIIFTPETESTKTSTLSTTTNVQNSPRLEIRIINVEWQEELSDPTSQEFATVSTNIENEVTFLLLNVSDILTFFIKVEVIQFKRGSVISVFDLIFNGTAPEQEKTAISEIQKSVVQDQKIGDLDVKELLAATSSQKNPEVLYRDPCHFTRCPDRMYCKSFINEYCISVCNENPNYCPLGSQCVNMTDHQTNPFIKCQCPAGTSGPNCTTEVTIMPTNNQGKKKMLFFLLYYKVP